MKKKVLFVGLTTVDIQYFVKEFPLPNQKLKTDPPLIYIGGPAANASITFSYMGGESNFLTCIGKNPFTQFIYEDLLKHSINIFDFVKDAEFDPVIASVITSLNSSERSIISNFPNVINDKKIDFVNWKDFDMVFIDGFYPEISIEVCKKAHENKLLTVFDGGSWKSGCENLLPFIDIAICSEHFFPPNCKKHYEVIKFLQKKGIAKIAITCGEKSIQWSENHEIKSIEIPITDSIDSLGAGDIFHGAFTFYWLNNNNFEQSLIMASKVASFSTRFKGTRIWMDYYKKHNP